MSRGRRLRMATSLRNQSSVLYEGRRAVGRKACGGEQIVLARSFFLPWSGES